MNIELKKSRAGIYNYRDKKEIRRSLTAERRRIVVRKQRHDGSSTFNFKNSFEIYLWDSAIYPVDQNEKIQI